MTDKGYKGIEYNYPSFQNNMNNIDNIPKEDQFYSFNVIIYIT